MIFAAAALLIIAAVALTLGIRQKDLPIPEPVSPTLHLEERKRAIYEGLRDLQFEYRMDKLSDADYQATKLELQAQLAGILAEIEKVQAGGQAHRKRDAASAKPRYICPKCSTEFNQPMKFCGQCGQPMPESS